MPIFLKLEISAEKVTLTHLKTVGIEKRKVMAYSKA